MKIRVLYVHHRDHGDHRENKIRRPCRDLRIDNMINLEGITKKHVNDVCFEIIGACIEVHKILGPGLLESVYEACLLQEFKLREIKAKIKFIFLLIIKE